jgi:hypothetical protein
LKSLFIFAPLIQKTIKKAGSNDFNIAHYNSFDYYLPIVFQSVKGDEYVFYSTAPTGFDLLGQFRFWEGPLSIFDKEVFLSLF